MGDGSRLKGKLTSKQFIAAATGFTSLFSLIGIMFYGLPFFYDYFVKEFGWSRARVTSGAAVGRVAMALFSFAAGWLTDRYGPKKLILVGVFFGGLGMVGLGMMDSLFQFYLFNLIAAAGYISGGPLPNQVLMSRTFKDARGKAMGIAYLGVGVGGMLVPHIAKTLIFYFNWHIALALLGILMTLIAWPFTWMLRPGKAMLPENTQYPIELKSVLKDRNFYLLVAGSICSIGAVSGTSQHLKLFLSLDLHFSQENAANLISLVLLSSIAGRLLMGWLADLISKKKVMMITYTLVAGSIGLLYFHSSTYTLYVFAVLFGIGLGGDYMVIPLMAAELFGVRLMGKVMGLVLSADILADALTPVLVGKLYDASGNYIKAFSILIAFGITGMLVVLFLPDKKSTINR